MHAAESRRGDRRAASSRRRRPRRRHGALPTLARATWSAGTIFAVYEKTSPGIGTTADILRTGNDIVAAGYCMYGAATELVICFKGSGVERFALDPSLGEFIHTHTNVRGAPSAPPPSAPPASAPPASATHPPPPLTRVRTACLIRLA